MKRRWPHTRRSAPFSEDDLRFALRVRFPGLPSISRLDGGNRNETFRLNSSDDTSPLVVKLYVDEGARPEVEAAIVNRIRPEVRTPPVVVQQLTVGEHPYKTAMMPFVRGRPGYAALEASANKRRAYAQQVGRLLAQVHRHRFEHCGYLDAELGRVAQLDFSGTGVFASLDKSLREPLVLDRIGQDEVAQLYDFAKRWCPELDARKWEPCLVHSDFGFENLRLDENDDLWILDWECSHVGDPLIDLGHILRPAAGDDALMVSEIERSYVGAGGVLPEQWRLLAGLLDLRAWLEFLERPVLANIVLSDARLMITRIVNTPGQ